MTENKVLRNSRLADNAREPLQNNWDSCSLNKTTSQDQALCTVKVFTNLRVVCTQDHLELQVEDQHITHDTVQSPNELVIICVYVYMHIKHVDVYV